MFRVGGGLAEAGPALGNVRDHSSCLVVLPGVVSIAKVVRWAQMAARGPAMPSSFQPEEKGQPPSLGDISEKFHAAPWLTFFWPV